MPEWTLHFDGLYEPRYRPEAVATFGFVVREGDRVIHEGKGLVAPPGPLASANVAEFGALIQGLSWLKENAPRDARIHVRGDSRLVCETVAGRWNLGSERLLPLRDLARRLASELDVADIKKVSRDENAEADRLSREAYHEAVRAHPEWGVGTTRLHG